MVTSTNKMNISTDLACINIARGEERSGNSSRAGQVEGEDCQQKFQSHSVFIANRALFSRIGPINGFI